MGNQRSPDHDTASDAGRARTAKRRDDKDAGKTAQVQRSLHQLRRDPLAAAPHHGAGTLAPASRQAVAGVLGSLFPPTGAMSAAGEGFVRVDRTDTSEAPKKEMTREEAEKLVDDKRKQASSSASGAKPAPKAAPAPKAPVPGPKGGEVKGPAKGGAGPKGKGVVSADPLVGVGPAAPDEQSTLPSYADLSAGPLKQYADEHAWHDEWKQGGRQTGMGNEGTLVLQALGTGATEGLVGGLAGAVVGQVVKRATGFIPFGSGFMAMGEMLIKGQNPADWLVAQGSAAGAKVGGGWEKLWSGDSDWIDRLEGVIDIVDGLNDVIGTLATICYIVAAVLLVGGLILSIIGVGAGLLALAPWFGKAGMFLSKINAIVGLVVTALRLIVMGARSIQIMTSDADPETQANRLESLRQSTGAFSKDFVKSWADKGMDKAADRVKSKVAGAKTPDQNTDEAPSAAPNDARKARAETTDDRSRITKALDFYTAGGYSDDRKALTEASAEGWSLQATEKHGPDFYREKMERERSLAAASVAEGGPAPAPAVGDSEGPSSQPGDASAGPTAPRSADSSDDERMATSSDIAEVAAWHFANQQKTAGSSSEAGEATPWPMAGMGQSESLDLNSHTQSGTQYETGRAPGEQHALAGATDDDIDAFVAGLDQSATATGPISGPTKEQWGRQYDDQGNQTREAIDPALVPPDQRGGWREPLSPPGDTAFGEPGAPTGESLHGAMGRSDLASPADLDGPRGGDSWTHTESGSQAERGRQPGDKHALADATDEDVDQLVGNMENTAQPTYKYRPAEVSGVTPGEETYAVRVGNAGAGGGGYFDHIFHSQAEAQAYADHLALRARDETRDVSALPLKWPNGAPGNRVEEVVVVAIPPFTPLLRSGIAPQPESEPGQEGTVYGGGGPQVQVPFDKRIRDDSAVVYRTPVTGPQAGGPPPAPPAAAPAPSPMSAATEDRGAPQGAAQPAQPMSASQPKPGSGSAYNKGAPSGVKAEDYDKYAYFANQPKTADNPDIITQWEKGRAAFEKGAADAATETFGWTGRGGQGGALAASSLDKKEAEEHRKMWAENQLKAMNDAHRSVTEDLPDPPAGRKEQLNNAAKTYAALDTEQRRLEASREEVSIIRKRADEERQASAAIGVLLGQNRKTVADEQAELAKRSAAQTKLAAQATKMGSDSDKAGSKQQSEQGTLMAWSAKMSSVSIPSAMCDNAGEGSAAAGGLSTGFSKGGEGTKEGTEKAKAAQTTASEFKATTEQTKAGYKEADSELASMEATTSKTQQNLSKAGATLASADQMARQKLTQVSKQKQQQQKAHRQAMTDMATWAAEHHALRTTGKAKLDEQMKATLETLKNGGPKQDGGGASAGPMSAP